MSAQKLSINQDDKKRPFIPETFCCVNDTAGVSEQLRKLLKTTAITGNGE
ncbi:hypothetical protein TUM12151_12470 [Morganella morganii]|nr:hypothetical protein TUM12149_08320 [Morganella morganii]GIZ29597.1 hypothetical protein TUM12150_00830 [Morganella morganii]GIZ34261.1 hypothetical protein TUM12151_12470 [Morganella morganii]